MPTRCTEAATCSGIGNSRPPGCTHAGKPDKPDRTFEPELAPPSKPSRTSKSPKPGCALFVLRSGPGRIFRSQADRPFCSRSIHVRALPAVRHRSCNLELIAMLALPAWAHPASEIWSISPRGFTSQVSSTSHQEDQTERIRLVGVVLHIHHLAKIIYAQMHDQFTRLSDRASRRRQRVLIRALAGNDERDGSHRTQE